MCQLQYITLKRNLWIKKKLIKYSISEFFANTVLPFLSSLSTGYIPGQSQANHQLSSPLWALIPSSETEDTDELKHCFKIKYAR